MSRTKTLFVALVACICGAASLFARAVAPEIRIADFEGADWQGWSARGDAFIAPCTREQGGQGPVTGYAGRGFANSWGADKRKNTGVLASPEFVIERDFVEFLIAGGDSPRTCVALVCEGRRVRATSGRNHWRMHPAAWDVRDLRGKRAHIELIDDDANACILADAFVQTDRNAAAADFSRVFTLEKDYLHFPHAIEAPAVWLRLTDADTGEFLREWVVRLADVSEKAPDFWLHDDVAEFKKRRVRLAAERLPEGSRALEGVRQSGDVARAETDYAEPLRPQFHYTPRRGRMNDINGFVKLGDTYHVMHQHNPLTVERGGVVGWGHCVSKDLIHWEERPMAIHADADGAIFSGSAVVDVRNTSGLKTGTHAPVVCLYTAAGGFTPASYGKRAQQCLAYSVDGGRTFKKYGKNPVLPWMVGGNRDPKVVWYAPKNHWVMALFMDGNTYAFFTSKNLLDWVETARVDIPGASECPDFFPLALDGDLSRIRWIFMGGNGTYLVGDFDGNSFIPTGKPQRISYGNAYAAQSLATHAPDAEELRQKTQLYWLMSNPKGMPFNQQMGLPRVLSLHTVDGAETLRVHPLPALDGLRGKLAFSMQDKLLVPSAPNPLLALKGDAWEIECVFKPTDDAQWRLEVFGVPIVYDAKTRIFSVARRSAPLAPREDGTVAMRLYVDRSSVEAFLNDGEAMLASEAIPVASAVPLALSAKDGAAAIQRLAVYPLSSIWAKP